MIVHISFKTPDAVDNAIEDLSEEEAAKVLSITKKYIKYGECVTLEVDTDNETITVI